jgi:hypothetical protein
MTQNLFKLQPLFEVAVSVYISANDLDQALDKVGELLSDAKVKGVVYYMFDERSEELKGDNKYWVLRKAGLEERK